MAETYEAQAEYFQSLPAENTDGIPVAARPRREDMDMFFFLDPAMQRLEGHLRGWMTQAPETRAKMVKEFKPQASHEGAECRRKALLWIISEESRGGVKEIAQAALNYLFIPKE